MLSFSLYYFTINKLISNKFPHEFRNFKVNLFSTYFINLFCRKGFLLKLLNIFNKINFWLLDFFDITIYTNFYIFFNFKILLFFKNFFFNYKFLFSFFFEKLNKKLYKFSNYKVSRYSIKFFFIKPYKRMKRLLFFFSRLLNFDFEYSDFRTKFLQLLFTFYFQNSDLALYKLNEQLHYFIYKHHKVTLFFLNKTV